MVDAELRRVKAPGCSIAVVGGQGEMVAEDLDVVPEAHELSVAYIPQGVEVYEAQEHAVEEGKHVEYEKSDDKGSDEYMK